MKFTDNDGGFDLLTTDDGLQRQPVSAVENLHNAETLPTAERRDELKKDVDTKTLKKDVVQEKIADAISSLQPKIKEVPKSPIDKIKDIISKGSISKEVELYGFKWGIHTLDQADRITMFDDVDMIASSSGKIPATTLMTVVYCLESLDGVSVYQWFTPDITLENCNNNRQEFIIKVRRALTQYLLAVPDALISDLYSEIAILESERVQALNELKNS